MFSPCVAFCVKITCSGRAAPKRAAASLRQRKAVCSARRTALEQTHFGVQTPDEAGETAERDAQRAESLAGTAEHGC